MKVIKSLIGYVCACMLSFTMVMIWNNGIAEAGLPTLATEHNEADGSKRQDNSGSLERLAGIAGLTKELAGYGDNVTEGADLTEKLARHWDNVTESAGSALGKVVGTAVETSASLASEMTGLLQSVILSWRQLNL